MPCGSSPRLHGSVRTQAGTAVPVCIKQPLTQAGFVVELKSALERWGVCSEGYSGHSFRIGAATTAAEAGVHDAVIQQLGGKLAEFLPWQGKKKIPKVGLGLSGTEQQ